MQIANTAAIVTGGASGLGAATAKALAAKGARVFAADLESSIAKAEATEGVTFVEADVTDAAAVQRAVDAATESGAPLRVVVNCAGIGPASRILSKKGPHDLDLFRKVVEVNLVGTFNVMTLAAQAMAATEPVDDKGQRGVVINTASVAAFEGQIGQIAYSASKGGMTIPAARDLASSGIRVMTIAPGIIDTPMMAGITEEFRESLAASVPFPKRLGTPDEYAQLALNIVEHDYLNGEVIRLDGALRMAPR
jgi:NAD(P)-dependent dehydrogenase (short-subunit alcohol dehydrogenase family)